MPNANAAQPDADDIEDADDLATDDDLQDVRDAVEQADRTAATPHERAGGSGREYAWLLIVGGLLGLIAALALTLDYFHVLEDENYTPACDINPLIGCGRFLESDQSHAFGFPNVIIGLVAYPVLMAIGALLAGGVRLPRWTWRTLLVGTVFGIGFVTWLQVQALAVIGALCPYCVVVWIATIPIFVHTVARTVQNGALGGGDGLRAFLVGNRWIITVLWYLLVVAAAVLIFWDKWLLVF